LCFKLVDVLDDKRETIRNDISVLFRKRKYSFFLGEKLIDRKSSVNNNTSMYIFRFLEFLWNKLN